MAKIDELLSKVMQAQSESTYLISCAEFPATHAAIKEARKNLTNAVADVLKHVTELENKLSDLTPHPDDAGYEADYDDHSRGW